jgi:hypothetical protein
MMLDDFKDITVSERGVLVGIEYIGEGECGDYNPADPDDKPLVRFWVSRKVGRRWEFVEDSSYCTGIPATTPRSQLRLHAERILSIVGDDVRNGESIKRTCERLSWAEL